MADQTAARLRLIAVLGLVLGVAFLTSAVVPSCLGCGGLTFEDPDQAQQFDKYAEQNASGAVKPMVAGMSIIGISGFFAQFAWRRHKNDEPLVPAIR